MSHTNLRGGFADDSAAALSVASSGCCGNPQHPTPPAAEPAEAAAPCCGTAAEAEQAASCCGAPARAEAVASGRGCCG